MATTSKIVKTEMETSKIIKTEPNEPFKSEADAKRRTPTRGLWTHEGRLFNERIIYLNKSTTKYLIIGIDPVEFEVVVRICCRTTGNHVTIPGGRFFIFVLKANDPTAELPGLELDCVNIKVINDLFWISETPKEGEHPTFVKSIALHPISIDKLLRIQNAIKSLIASHDCIALNYKRIVDSFRSKTAAKDDAGTMKFLYGQLGMRGMYGVSTDSDTYNVALDMICNQDYFETLDLYKGFYNEHL